MCIKETWTDQNDGGVRSLQVPHRDVTTHVHVADEGTSLVQRGRSESVYHVLHTPEIYTQISAVVYHILRTQEIKKTFTRRTTIFFASQRLFLQKQSLQILPTIYSN